MLDKCIVLITHGLLKGHTSRFVMSTGNARILRHYSMHLNGVKQTKTHFRSLHNFDILFTV